MYVNVLLRNTLKANNYNYIGTHNVENVSTLSFKKLVSL